MPTSGPVLQIAGHATAGDGRHAPNLSVERAMAILSAFGPGHPHLGVSELARRFELSRSAVSRLLASLESAGYVVQDPRTGRFSLGVRALELGYCYSQTSELLARAAPHLVELARRLEMNAHLYGLSDGQMFRYLIVPYPTGVGTLAAYRGFAHASAGGKVLLAHAAPEVVTQVIDRWGLPANTHNTITDPERLRRHLDEVRRQGWALDDEENHVGSRCLAAPVSNANGVVAAATVSAQRSRLPDEAIPHVRDQLLEATNQISAALGHGLVLSTQPDASRNGY